MRARGIAITAMLAVLVGAAMPALAASGPRPRAGAKFTGRTAQDLPIRFSISRDGRYVENVTFEYRWERCPGHKGERLRSRIDGRFKIRSDGSWGDPATRTRFTSSRRAQGSFRMHLDDRRGRVVCDTGKVTWTARAR